MSISAERKMAEKYFLETDTVNGEKMVQLTKRNVAKVEAMIAFNSAYNNSKPKGKNKKSTADLVSKFGKFTAASGTELDEANRTKYRRLIGKIVASIDRENSTHLNADKKGRKVIADRIRDNYETPNDLINTLKSQKSGYKLIELLSQPVPKSKKEPNKGRRNFSFATKFCHYMAFYLFDGKRSQDNFSIYDGIMEKAIRKHAEQLGVDIPKNMKSFKGHYVEYMKTIDDVRDACKKKNRQNISRNGLDHLLWYYYK